MTKKNIYKIIFHNQGKTYEIFAHSVHEGNMFGFITIEDIVFGEKTKLVVDPTEENLKSEFNGVSRTYLPMHSIIRIDEVKKEGIARIRDLPKTGSDNITHIPIYTSAKDPK